MLRLRALSFVFGLPLMLSVCYFDGWWLFAVVVALAGIGLGEWHKAVSLTSARPNRWLSGALIFGLLLGTQIYLRQEIPLNALLVSLLTLAVAAAFVSRIFCKGGASALNDIGATLLPVLYIGLLFSFPLRLRGEAWNLPRVPLENLHLPSGSYVLVLLFLTCWGMDTVAYLCGRFIGGPKLCPEVSPGKTIAGLIGAVITSAAFMAAGFWLCGLSAMVGIFLGGAMGIVSQLGDLSKSLIKREVGLKDFGSVFPGHGGVLDRFDGFLFLAPLLFYFLKWIL
jgi:phosphatidate cytidylyltransferase